ncbi:MAG: DnaB-like helicase C-terminal domain-containing protein [Phycisphaerae bacterium]
MSNRPAARSDGFWRVPHDELSALLRRRDLLSETARVYLALADLTWGYGKARDIVSIGQVGELAGIERPNVARAFRDLAIAESTPGAANVPYYVGQIVEARKRRDSMLAGLDLRAKAADWGEPLADTLTSHNRALYEIMGQRQQTGGAAGEIGNRVLVEIERIQREGLTPGLWTGMAPLDAATGGLRPGNVLVLAANRAQGKSALAGAVALHVAKAGRPALFVSLEMEPSELTTRFLANLADVPHSVLRGARPTAEQWTRLQVAQGELDKLPLRIVAPPSPTVEAVASEIAVAGYSMGRPPALVVLDYLQLVEGGRSASEYEIVTRASRQIKALARGAGVPFILLCQLNRQAELEKRRPELHDLRQSGQIENDADAVLLLWSDPDRPADGFGTIETWGKLAKNRHGPTLNRWPDENANGGGIILRWRPAVMRFNLAQGDGGKNLQIQKESS